MHNTNVPFPLNIVNFGLVLDSVRILTTLIQNYAKNLFKRSVSLMIFLLLGGILASYGQIVPDSVNNSRQTIVDSVDAVDKITSIDSTKTDSIVPDSLLGIIADTIETDTLPFNVSADSIEAPIDYTANDSIIYDLLSEKVYLFGEAKVTYQTMNLTAEYIILDWANKQIIAFTDSNELGEPIGSALFNDGDDEYQAKKIIYNYQTNRGKVFKARTQDGEGYILADEVKRNENEEWYGRNGKYTTCNLEEPHFYIKAKKMKLVPDKVIVTGPANLVVREVPTPLVLPFGIFPIQKERTSGILIPQPGERADIGFFLENGGFYIHVKDVFDVEVRSLISTTGTWNVTPTMRYNKRYKFNGNAILSYGQRKSGFRDDPNFSVQNNFRVQWRHTQDPKATPNSNFTANVNFGSSRYNQNFTTEQQSVVQSQFVSKVSYSKSWTNVPINLSVNVDHSQSLQTRQVDLTLPNLRIGTNRIQPFKSKKPRTKTPFWETIGFNYTFDTKNQLRGADSTFFSRETLDRSLYGAQHNIPVSASVPILKYFVLNPRFNYTERWYFKTQEKRWDPTVELDTTGGDSTFTFGQVITDTINGFKAARDFGVGVDLTTNLYGYLRFKKGKIKAFRHKLTPTISFDYAPDFSNDRWGYYKTVQTDTMEGSTEQYSIFQPSAQLYGQPTNGATGTISVRLQNNLEMKVFSKKDTVDNEKKIKLLEQLNIGGNYNFFRDSLKMSDINISGFTTLFEKVRVQFGVNLSPYARDSLNRRYDTFVWQDRKRLTEFSNASLAISTNLRSKQGGAAQSELADTEEARVILASPNDYYDFTIPWSIGFSYNFGISNGFSSNRDTIVVSNNTFSVNLDITITPKWKIVTRTGYDFVRRDVIPSEVTVLRNMHCWELGFYWVPYPLENSVYRINLNVKSAILQDLKLSRKSGVFDTAF